jgi:TolB protein
LGSPTPSPAASAHPTPAPTVLPSPLPSISPQLPLAEFQRTGAKNYAATTESWARGFNRYLLAWNSPYQLRTTNYSTELSIWLDQFQSSSDYVIGSFDFMFVPLPQSGSSKIVFASNRDGNDQIYSMNTDGSSLIRLTSNLSNDEHPRWSPNGTKILFQSDRDDSVSRTHHVYVMNADGSGQTRLTTDATDDCNAEWSGDGTKIVFQSLRNGSYYQIYTMNADGSGQVNVSNGTAADTQPSWSPNGLKIAFDSERDHVGRSSIYVMNANGTNQTRLTFSVDPFMDQGPIWSHDALKLAFVSTRDSTIDTWQETDDDGGIITKSAVRINKEIYSMNVDGSNQVRLTNTLENDDAPAWSPDNTKIVFHSDRERDDSDPTPQLWTMNIDGTNQALISSNPFGDYSPSWTNNAPGNQPPVANAGGQYTGVVAQNVSFNASGSFDPDGTITSYAWTFGDGVTGSGVMPMHTYAATGTYSVTMTVTDNLGAQASATTSATISTAGSDQYLANFNQNALARPPNANESLYWSDILKAAYPNGQTSMVLAVRELGKTLFESADYAARNRDNHWYVYDLYKTYLMREPDASGWAFWESVCNSNGRENVRRAFDECSEFGNIVATLTPSGSPSSTVSSLASARVDPFNQPRNGLTSQDAEWSVSLPSLPGRAGLDLGLSLSYSSMVWTRSGPYIYFDEDNGWPSPGFRLGFPTIQERVFDAQVGRNVYLMSTGGSRVSLRQMGTTNVYEAADSSYLQLIDNGGSLLVRTTDGTQLSYQAFNNEWHCIQIKDRNGNYSPLTTTGWDKSLRS